MPAFGRRITAPRQVAKRIEKLLLSSCMSRHVFGRIGIAEHDRIASLKIR